MKAPITPHYVVLVGGVPGPGEYQGRKLTDPNDLPPADKRGPNFHPKRKKRKK
jgi:hypothetical protein